jgi:glycosyltransferase involved in cell wall biosynthesis
VAGNDFDVERKSEYKGIILKDVFTINGRGLAAVTSSVIGTIKVAFGKYDVVHIHAEGPAFMCWLPKLCGKKVIVTIHGLDWARAKWGKFASWYIRTGEKMAVKHADEIIVLSNCVKKYFEKTYGRKTKFIPNGVNRPGIKEAFEIKKQWGLEKDKYILFLGRLVPEKGVHYLIEAAKGLGMKLVIVGGSSDTPDYMDQLKKMGEEVIFTGFQQGEVLEELYSNAYIYCLPSDLEGMPLSLLEAMSYGNCCVVSDISECAEVVEDKEVTFKNSNVEDLRNKLEWLIANPDVVNRYKKEAADFICNKYSWDDVVEKTEILYRGE